MFKSYTPILFAILLTAVGAAPAMAGEPGTGAGDRLVDRMGTLMPAAQKTPWVTLQRETATPVQRASVRASAAHTYADGRRHHTDPDAFIVSQLERDCPAVYNR